MDTLNIRALTTVSKKYNELPTQIAYHMQSMERSMVELATTGSLDPDPDATPITDRVAANEEQIAINVANLQANLDSHATMISRIKDNKLDIDDIKEFLDKSPIQNMTLAEWQPYIQSQVENNTNAIGSIQNTLGDPMDYGYATSDVIWKQLSVNRSDILTVSGQVLSLRTRVEAVEDNLASSPNPNRDLQAWAADMQGTIGGILNDGDERDDRLDDLESSQAAQDELLNDLIVAW